MDLDAQRRSQLLCHPDIYRMAVDHPNDYPDDPSASVWTDEASNMSRPDPSGAVQIDAEHPSRNQKVAGSDATSAKKWNRLPFRSPALGGAFLDPPQRRAR
jgi:hypothetical protein